MAVTIDTLQLDIQAADASGAVSSLRKLSSALARFSVALDKLDIAKMSQFSSALRRFSGSANSLSASPTSGLTASLQKTGAALGTTSVGASKASDSLLRGMWRVGKFAYAARIGTDFIAEAIGKSNEYVENLNLFTVALGGYADEAKAYAEQVQAAMGVDASDWMRAQGIFDTLLTGFGTGADDAAFMSKNLTQLGYDLSSFFNIAVQGEGGAMQKLKSGIAGELEPLRALGFDLSDAKLKAIALANGITQSTNSMTQAQKAQLRYVAIMTQVTTAQGDMARTLSSPANQLRILQAQLNLTARALGNIFIPALNAVLPVAIAFLQVIRAVADGIASLFGFSMPEFDYSGISGATEATENLGTALGGAGGAAKELKGQLAKFDELNVISQTSGGGGGGGGGNLSGLFDGLELPGYDFLAGIQDQVAGLKEDIKELLPFIEAVAVGLLAWKFPALGLAVDFGITYLAFLDALTNGFTKENIIQMLIGVLSGTIGGWALTGSLAGGLAIGIGVALTAIITAIIVKNDMDYKKKVREAFDAAFGTVTLTHDQTVKLAESLLKTTPFYVTVHTLLDAYAEVEALKPKVANVVTQLDTLNYKVTVGAKLGEEGVTAYHSLVDDLAKNLTDYAVANGKFVALAVQLGEVSEAGGAAVATLTGANIKYINSLAEQANKLFTDSFSKDGVLTNWDTYKEAMKMVEKMKKFSDIVAASKQTATLQTLQLKWSGVDLTAASYTDFQTELNRISGQLKTDAETAFQDKLSALNSTIEFAKLTLDANPDDVDALKALSVAQAELDRMAKDNTYQVEMDKIELRVSDMAYNTMAEALGNFVGEATTTASKDASYWFSEMVKTAGDPATWPADVWTQNSDNIATGLTDELARQFKAKPDDVQKAITLMVESGAMSANNKIKTLQSLPKTGEAATLALVDGLNTYKTAAAMAGEVNAVWYMVGKQYAESPDYLASLSKVKDLASGLNDSAKEGLAANLDSITEGVDGSISVIVNGVLTKFPKINQTLFDNFAALGIDLRDYVKNIPSDIDTAMADAFKKQNFDQSVTATLTIDTYINERIHSASALTASAQKAIISSKTTASGLLGGLSTLRAAGGFPEKGEMFIAREAGPELVGTIGGKTTVANNDQIVEGIASGVATANQEQNALLREQNALLRAILDKDDGLEPSPAWGAFMEQSSRLYAKAGGR